MKYEDLLNEAANDDIYIIENADFTSKAEGLINGNVIGINRNIRSYTKRSCILAEEIGHFRTTAGNIINQSDICNRKQERKARAWAYNKMVGLYGIIRAYQEGCNNIHESAEYLQVTEDFLSEAIDYYKEKYGTHASVDNYVIYFEPSIGVFELI